MDEIRYVLTNDGVTVVLGGRAYSISSHQQGFSDIREAVVLGQDPVRVLGLIQAKANAVRAAVEAHLESQNLGGRLTYEEGLLYFDGALLRNYAADTLVKFLRLGHDCQALARFVEKQQQNPDKTVHEELYKFLEFGKIPLTPDGNFLAYKAVRADYKDIHSGRFDNSVGQAPRLKEGREGVDPDRNNTCSRGLHVCSFGYLPHFAHAQGHVMICEVDPRDVVAIPSDYNNTKMRVIGYRVVEEVTSYYTSGVDILSQDRLADEHYRVEYDEGDGLMELYDHFYTLEEAKKQAESLVDDASTKARVIDTRTKEVVHVVE